MKRWLVRGGIALGVLVLLIVAFYVEENWRGARLWAATKAKYEAKGFSFDPKSLIPPPIPDEENFAASPSWKRILDSKNSEVKPRPKSALLNARKTVQEWRSKNHIKGNWELGQLPVAPPIELFAPAQEELAQLYVDALRPQCQFPLDLSNPFPPARSFPELNPSFDLALALQAHSLAILQTKTHSAVLSDIALGFKLARANGNNFSLISGLVSISLTQIQLTTIWSGIEQHQWSDPELVKLQRLLPSIDLLQTQQNSVRSELIYFFVETMSWLQNKHPRSYRAINYFCSPISGAGGEQYYSYMPNPYAVMIILSPSGWFDETKAEGTILFMTRLLDSVDVAQRRFFPQKLISPEDFKNLRTYQPVRMLLAFALPNGNECVIKFAHAQSYLDMAQVACGLERYWLVNRKYPATLAELEPKFIAKVPHDLCNGEPLHYRVGADGNYVLYSVGFNGTDDGGKVVMKKEYATAIDPKLGDWVWPRQGFSQSSPRR